MALRSLSTRHVLGVHADSALHGTKISEGMVDAIPKKVSTTITSMPALRQRLTDALKMTPGWLCVESMVKLKREKPAWICTKCYVGLCTWALLLLLFVAVLLCGTSYEAVLQA